MIDKVTSVDESLERLTDGVSIMVGGFMTVGTPETLIDALVSRQLRHLVIICNDAGIPGCGVGKLVRAGMIQKLYASHVGLNPEIGQLIADGSVDSELVPQGTLAERIRAAGTGLGGFLTPTGVGTEVERGKQKLMIGGKEYLLEVPLWADAALVKAHCADRSGNLVFRKSARNFNPLMAMAAKYVIAEAEVICEVGDIDQDHVMLPGIFVDAVVHTKKEMSNA